MDDEQQDGGEEQGRADRDRERSHEAHWQVAEAGAEADEPKQQAPKAQETPVANGGHLGTDDEKATGPK